MFLRVRFFDGESDSEMLLTMPLKGDALLPPSLFGLRNCAKNPSASARPEELHSPLRLLLSGREARHFATASTGSCTTPFTISGFALSMERLEAWSVTAIQSTVSSWTAAATACSFVIPPALCCCSRDRDWCSGGVRGGGEL
jgi:hypothetical protein